MSPHRCPADDDAAVGRRNDGLLGPGTDARHLMTLLTVEVANDTAKAVAYFVFVFVFVKGTAIVSSGTYHDDLARTGAGWRIARREIILA
jgi:3-phenylpropionate/cinnamic acid dioxygenase small subunit